MMIGAKDAVSAGDQLRSGILYFDLAEAETVRLAYRVEVARDAGATDLLAEGHLDLDASEQRRHLRHNITEFSLCLFHLQIHFPLYVH